MGGCRLVPGHPFPGFALGNNPVGGGRIRDYWRLRHIAVEIENDD